MSESEGYLRSGDRKQQRKEFKVLTGMTQKAKSLESSGHPLRGGCVSLKLFQSLWSGLVQVESATQPGSAAKAAFSLERPCPMKSMAPVLAIV